MNRTHFAAVAPLLDLATRHADFFDSGGGTYSARYGIADTDLVRRSLSRFEWNPNYSFEPTVSFMEDAIARGLLADWVILVPELQGGSVVPRIVNGRDEPLYVLKRTRRPDRGDMFSGSSPRQRTAMEIISGGADAVSPATKATVNRTSLSQPTARRLHTTTRGALLLTFAADDGSADSNPSRLPDPVDPNCIATLFSLAFPKASAPSGRFGFTVKVQGGGAIVPRS